MVEITILNSDKGVYAIGIFAKMLQVHQRTLRIYDAQGLLCPTRTDKNRRMYSQNDLEKGKIILFLTRNLAMNLFSVKVFLGIIEENKIEFKDCISRFNEIMIKQGIDEKIQQQNILKSSRRGRKPKSKFMLKN